ncbi:tRNA1(Val) (adenine(37)-N6)-methyltransferase [Thermodesulfobacteriota bacterium]
MNILSIDTFFNGRIKVRQHRHGYRFSIDAILLAHHVTPRPGDRILDLGTGCGIIALILAYRCPDIDIVGIEVQKELAEVAALNVKENFLEDRICIVCDDLKAVGSDAIPRPVNIIVSNPPYRQANSGRINPNRQKAVARHEIEATLTDFVKAAHRLLQKSGRLVTIYPAERTVDLIAEMRYLDIEPKFLRMIHSTQDKPAKLILVEGRRGARRGTMVGPPLVIYDQDGSYTSPVQKMFQP